MLDLYRWVVHSFSVRADVIVFFRLRFVEAETANIKLSLTLENFLEFMLPKVFKATIDFNDFISYLLPTDFPLHMMIVV